MAVAMGPGKRHITKPVCEITYELREEGIDTSVIVINAGSGVPADAPDVSTGSLFGLDQIEIERIQQFKVALIHLGNVKNHIIYKARLILRNVDMPAVIVCQAPVDFEDFARIGVKTRVVMPARRTSARRAPSMEIITGVVRGQTSPRPSWTRSSPRSRSGARSSASLHSLISSSYNGSYGTDMDRLTMPAIDCIVLNRIRCVLNTYAMVLIDDGLMGSDRSYRQLRLPVGERIIICPATLPASNEGSSA